MASAVRAALGAVTAFGTGAKGAKVSHRTSLEMQEQLAATLCLDPCDRDDDASQQLSDFVTTVPFFAKMERGQRELLCPCLTRHACENGEVVIRAGDFSREFYVIVSGTVAVHMPPPPGQRMRRRSVGHAVALLGPGDAFGELALLRNEPRNATLVAVGPCTFAVLAPADYAELLQRHVIDEGLVQWKVSTLRLVPALSGLSVRELTQLSYFFLESEFRFGECVTAEGAAATHLAVIVSGECIVACKQACGCHGLRCAKQHPRIRLGPQSVLGAVDTLSRAPAHRETAVVASPRVRALRIAQKDVMRHLRHSVRTELLRCGEAGRSGRVHLPHLPRLPPALACGSVPSRRAHAAPHARRWSTGDNTAQPGQGARAPAAAVASSSGGRGGSSSGGLALREPSLSQRGALCSRMTKRRASTSRVLAPLAVQVDARARRLRRILLESGAEHLFCSYY